MTTLGEGEFLAPDGIIIRPIPGVASALTSVVVGIIPPRDGDYSTHLHYGLEQVTYVVSGQVTVVQQTQQDAVPVEMSLGAGQAITTPPASTLSFRNHGPEPAEVLFICVPPYPPTNADTEVLVEGHRALTPDELETSVERLERAQEYLDVQLEARLSTLRWLAPATEADE